MRRENFKLPSLRTNEGVIYSYAMPVAKMKFNRTIEIVNKDESPSVTTSTHINGIVELAKSNGYTIMRAEKIK